MASPAPPEPSAPERATTETTLALAVIGGAVKPLDQMQTQARRLGVRLFPLRPGEDPSRWELAALATALVGAAFVGSTLPGSPVQAATGPVAAAPLLLAGTPLLPAPTPAAAADSSSSDTSSGETASADDTSAAGAATTDPALPAATTDDASSDTSADDTSGATDEGAAPGDGSDPLAGGGGTTLARVALIVTHGDAPAAWPSAAAGSPAKQRAALGTTFTELAVLPGAPLSTSLAYIAGQPSNPMARAGCTAAQPVTPGSVDDAGTTTGSGCDYPADATSVPGAVARDGRTWKAYTPAATAAEAAARLCHPYDGTAGDAATAAAQQSGLGHLADLTGSGACDAAAAPLSELATDLGSDAPPAWIYVDATGATPAERDAAVDGALKALTGTAPPDDGKSATLVVGDGTDEAPKPADAGAYPASSPTDPTAPAAVASGALLVGEDVEAGTTDPLALDPFAIARTQATWLGLTPPGLAAGDAITALKVPGA